MKYVIPSLKRSTILKNRTLKLLEQHNVMPNEIYIFCVKEEVAKYYQDLTTSVGCPYNIIAGKKGIAEQRNFISNYFDENEKIVTIDDDVEEIYSWKSKKKIVPLKNLKKFIDKCFKIMDKEKTKCCGVYPVKNPFYMNDNYTTNLKFCIGQFRCFYNIKEIEASRTFNLLEDYEITLKYYLNYGKIIRFNNICLKANYASLCGGLNNTDRRYITKTKEVEQFYNSFSIYCFIKDRETDKGPKIDIGLKEKAGALNIWCD